MARKDSTTVPVAPHALLETPQFLLHKLRHHPLTKALYPVRIGRINVRLGEPMRFPETPQYRLLYQISGESTLTRSSGKYSLQWGDLVVVEPDRDNQLVLNCEEESSLYWVEYQGELAPDFTERLTMKMPSGPAHVGVHPRTVSDFDTLLALETQGYTATNVIHAVHLLQQILSYLALQLRVHQPPGQSSFDLEIIETLMMEKLHDQLSLETLARRVNLSRFHFAKKFKAATGKSPIEYFIEMKIQHACYLLEQTNSSVKQIAATLGYPDAYYFSRLFRKRVGCSPGMFRQRRSGRPV